MKKSNQRYENTLAKFLILLILAALIGGCKSRGSGSNNQLTYEDFSKIIAPKDQISPLAGGKSSFLLMRAAGDDYYKIYTLDHSTKKLTLKFDAGRNISNLYLDAAYKNYYFSMDDGGNELYKINSWNPQTNEVKAIFGHDGASSRIADTSHDGKRLYIISNHENTSLFRLYKLNLKDKKLEALSDKRINVRSANVNQNETYAAITIAFGNNESHIYLLNLKTLKAKRLLAKSRTVYRNPFFDPGNPFLYFTSNDNSDRYGCARINYKTPGSIQWLFQDDRKDISCFYNEVEDHTVISQSYDGRRKLKFYSGIFEKEIPIDIPDKSFPSQLTKVPGLDKAVLMISKADSPGEYYITDLSKGKSSKPEMISNFNDRIKEKDMGESFDLYYKSFDGQLIHGIFFAKKEWTLKEKKYPVILWIHGGPDSYVKHNFHPFIQFAVANGFIVFAPNFRGSAGYGKKFETLNDLDWGGGDVEDITRGKAELSKLPYVDPSKTFIAGVSFGGFLTLSTTIKHREDFSAASVILPITDLRSFLKNMPKDLGRIYEFYREIGDPRKHSSLINSRSPISNADMIKTPLLIFQAENDSRIKKEETDAFVKKMTDLDLPVTYKIIKNDGHNLNKKGSWEMVFNETISFFKERLKHN